MVKILCLFCVLIVCCKIDPDSKQKQYLIVLDAGSSGTRLHLFQYSNVNQSAFHHQSISEILNVKTSPGISSFAQNLVGIEKNLRPIFDATQEKLNANSVDLKSVPLLFYSTAGMRLLTDDEQNKIYAEIQKVLKTYKFDVKEVKTIDGKTEGLYAWLSVNELSHSFSQEKTNGILEMGGASMQIAFELYDHHAKCQENDTISCVFIDGKMHKVFSLSFLGLGQNMALNEINTHQNAGVCYPKGYAEIQNTNGFDFENCSRFFHALLDNAHVQTIVPEHEKNGQFFALSSFGYLADFFRITQPVKKDDLKLLVQEKCSNDWSVMHAQCNEDETCREQFSPYMHTYCVLGVYFQTLLNEQYYKIKDDDVLYAQSKIDGVVPDWPLGAAVYYRSPK